VAQAIVEHGETPDRSYESARGDVAKAVRTREPGKHPATRTFQALRMFINDELGQLEKGLAAALEFLSPVDAWPLSASILSRSDSQTLHEASDRDRSRAARSTRVATGAEPRLKLVGRKSRAVAAEVDTNPRARSAAVASRSEDQMTSSINHDRCASHSVGLCARFSRRRGLHQASLPRDVCRAERLETPR